MSNLEESSLLEVIKEYICEKGVPFLGICLGMQLLFESSDEQKVTRGLDLLRGKVRRIQCKKGLTVPHVGWNSLCVERIVLYLQISLRERCFTMITRIVLRMWMIVCLHR